MPGRDADSDDDDSTDEVEEKPARPEKVTAPDPLPTRTRNGIDFSGCFSFLVSGSDPSPPPASSRQNEGSTLTPLFVPLG